MSAQDRPFASVVVPLPADACRHPSYRCSPERRGADYVLVCPCGHVRVCRSDSDATVWAHLDQARLARKLSDERIKAIARGVQRDIIDGDAA